METPLHTLSRARAGLSPLANLTYAPAKPAHRPGGDLDDSSTLARVLPAAAAGNEIMLLCMGSDGTLRMGANLIRYAMGGAEGL